MALKMEKARDMRVVDDTFNNIGRRCDVIGHGMLGPKRAWKILTALKDDRTVGSVTHYVLVNDSSHTILAPADSLYNLY